MRAPLHPTPFLGLCLLLLSGAVLTADPAPGFAELRLTITNVRHPRGTVYAGLFRPGGAFPKTEGRWRYTKAEPEGAAVRLVFTNVPPGTYAVGFYQDLNGDREHGRGFLGIPKEPFGFYRHARPRLKEPGFEECAFTLTSGVTEAATAMQEWGTAGK